MADRLTDMVLAAQTRIFRLAERDYGLSLKAISVESGIPYNTIRSYNGHNGAPVAMPLTALLKLVGVIPDDLLSHLLDPVDRRIADTETADIRSVA
jgi:hypothetical protein